MPHVEEEYTCSRPNDSLLRPQSLHSKFRYDLPNIIVVRNCGFGNRSGLPESHTRTWLTLVHAPTILYYDPNRYIGSSGTIARILSPFETVDSATVREIGNATRRGGVHLFTAQRFSITTSVVT